MSCARVPSRQRRKLKLGVPFQDYKDQIRPLDLILFKGGDAVSDTIRFLEKHFDGHGDYSHVGVIVTTAVLSHPRMQPGRLYILESTVTGFLGCGVKNIDGESFFGVQLTDFEQLLEGYDKSDETRVAVAHLSPRYVPTLSTKALLQQFWERMRGRSYQFNMYAMLSAIFPFMRGGRRLAEKLLGGGDWVFCSQLACQVYQSVGVFPPNVDSASVVPEDLLGYDSDKQVPTNVFTSSEPTCLLGSKWTRRLRREIGSMEDV
jgi:hypothetical protein